MPVRGDKSRMGHRGIKRAGRGPDSQRNEVSFQAALTGSQQTVTSMSSQESKVKPSEVTEQGAGNRQGTGTGTLSFIFPRRRAAVVSMT